MVISQHTAQRSYVIQTTDGTLLRRKRCHLKKTNKNVVVTSPSYDDDDDDDDDDDTQGQQQEHIVDDDQNSDSHPCPLPDVTEKRSG